MSATELARRLESDGVSPSAITHRSGDDAGISALADRFPGPVQSQFLYLWTRRTRHPTWMRPMVGARQLVVSGAALASSTKVSEFGRLNRVDLIHTSTSTTPEGAIAAMHLGVPHVWHVRELIGPTGSHRIFGDNGPLGVVLTHSSSAVIANSALTARYLERFAPDAPIYLVRNGIDVARFRDLPPRPKESDLVIGMVGTPMATWKRHDLFIHAAARLATKAKVRFVIFGRLPNPGSSTYGDFLKLQSMAERAGLQGRLRFVDNLDTPEGVMASLDILVQPTAAESFGRVVVEAMAAAKPVVSVEGGTAIELFEPGVHGFVAQPNADDLARAVLTLIEDIELRKKFGYAAQEYAARHHSLESHSARVSAIYGEAIRERRLPMPLSRAWAQIMPRRFSKRF